MVGSLGMGDPLLALLCTLESPQQLDLDTSYGEGGGVDLCCKAAPGLASSGGSVSKGGSFRVARLCVDLVAGVAGVLGLCGAELDLIMLLRPAASTALVESAALPRVIERVAAWTPSPR